MIDRRHLIGAGLASASFVLAPERLFAAAAPAEWTLGVADVERDVVPRAMRRINGRAPDALKGTLFRNGPAKFRRPGGSATHWFDGDGMIRRFEIAAGEARLSARFVDTPKRRLENSANAVLTPGFGTVGQPGAVLTGPDSANAANTSVLHTGSELWALWEAGSPFRIDPATLATLGPKVLRADLKAMPFLAHPRVDPEGTIWNLGVAGSKAMLWQLAPGGALAQTRMIELPRASYIHDFTATARHLVIVLQPWIATRSVLPYNQALEWKPDAGTLVLVIDKADPDNRRTVELPPFSFFHLGDAWEEQDGTIRFDACVYDDPRFALSEASELLTGRGRLSAPELAMVVLPPSGAGRVERTATFAEFPQGDKRRAGSRRRHTIFAGLYGERPFARGVGLYDWDSGKAQHFNFGERRLVEEFLFVPRGEAEKDGWLVGTTLNLDARATELHVFDARSLSAGPVATWRADVALPVGFHGTFVPA